MEPNPLDAIRKEPRAELRQAATAMREMFVALVQTGFTEEQALTLVGNAMGQAKGK